MTWSCNFHCAAGLSSPAALHLEIDTRLPLPSHEGSFGLVPHLRSLVLTLYDSSHRTEPPVDFERMLNSLPQLVAFRCVNIRLGIRDLLTIACHSTLEELHIECSRGQLNDDKWLGQDAMCFHSKAQENEKYTQSIATHGGV